MISIKRLDMNELEKRGVFSWPIWEKEVSVFEWFYDTSESCYFLEGQVEVIYGDGKSVCFGKGDFVTFPEGLSCTWKITTPVKKHYYFG